MISKTKIILVAVVVIFGVSGTSFAMSCDMGSMDHSGKASTQDAEKGSSATNAGNKICPISGDPVDGKTTYEYKGKVYNFCCPMCIAEFKNNPKGYSAKAEQAAGSEHLMQEGHHH